MVASMCGTGVHAYIERLLRTTNSSRYELERQVVLYVDDRYVSGRFDILLDGRNLWDVKTAKTWKTVFDPEMKDWHAQQNLYAYMLGLRGTNIETINILCVYTDWKAGDAIRNPNYPQDPIIAYPLQLWPAVETEDYLHTRLALHKACEGVIDAELPPCTDEDCWARFPEGVARKYAVMKHSTAKRATRVFVDWDECVEYCKATGWPTGAFVEIRHAVRKRCEEYCTVNTYCKQYQMYMAGKQTNQLNEIVPMELIIGG